MNKQGKLIDGKVVGGIEWVKTKHDDGTESQGYTWNPIGGCKHACRWEMPDGTIAQCYAETVATRVAQSSYPEGFATHYWNPKRLREPTHVKIGAKIFMDSMSDLMGAWVPPAQIEAVLDVCRKTPQHIYQMLTKNAPRLKQFDFPQNVWVGISAPPTFMFGNRLTERVRSRMANTALDALEQVNVPVRWVSIEPLSFDIAPLLENRNLQWAVIGAATNGRMTYQPETEWVQNVLDVLDQQGTKVFFKGNLEWAEWREDFPNVRQ